jgi:hypothetical protein
MSRQNRVRNLMNLAANFARDCGPGTDYPWIHIFQCTLERTDAITNEVLEPITFVLAYPTVCYFVTTEDSLILHMHMQFPIYGEVLGDKSTMYIRMTVLSHFFQYSSGFILYRIYVCMFWMLLFKFVNYVFWFRLCILIVMLCIFIMLYVLLLA